MLDEEKFFSDVADEAGFTDVQSVKTVYMAMVRVLTKRLIKYYGTRMPHLGDVMLPMFKSKTARFGTKTVKLPPRRHLKFYPDQNWHKHINAKLGYRNY